MTDDDLLQRITLNPGVMTGKPTIRGLRITVEQLLLALAHGVSQEALLADYPELEPDDLRAALPINGGGCVSESSRYRLEPPQARAPFPKLPTKEKEPRALCLEPRAKKKLEPKLELLTQRRFGYLSLKRAIKLEPS
jgi:uncharacterized protein (DUF433 family)